MVPSDVMLKSERVPLPYPFWKVLAVALGADDGVSRELPVASCKFQVMLMSAAPSAKPAIAMPVTGAAGVARVPSGLKVTFPVLITVAAPVPPVSAAGRVML